MVQVYNGMVVCHKVVMAELASHFKIDGRRCAPNNTGTLAIFTRCYEAQYDQSACGYARRRIENDTANYVSTGFLPSYVLRTHQLSQ